MWVSGIVQPLEKDCHLVPKLVTLALGVSSAFDDSRNFIMNIIKVLSSIEYE